VHKLADSVYASTGLSLPLLETAGGCAERGRVCSGACDRASSLLPESLVGQREPARVISDAVCDHWSAVPAPERPLAIAVHGPPGVGKSFAHRLLARAAFNASSASCPGPGCRAYRSLFATDYAQANETEHALRIKQSLEHHLRRFPAGIIALEEYDRAGCNLRGLLRHLLDSGVAGSAAAPRSVIVLEANTGWGVASSIANGTLPGEKASLTGANGALKSLMHRAWKAEHCGETSVDTQRLISLISNFVPFFPLDFDSVRELCERNLRERRAALLANDGTQLSWDRAVPDRMADQVEYTNGFAAEGASSARRADRFVSRAVRSVQADVMARAERQPDALRLQVERGNIVARVGDVA